MSDIPPLDLSTIEALQTEVDRLSALVVTLNDAQFGLSGILARVIVDAELVGRSELADAIKRRAGPTDADDHNPLLLAFARAVRMNFPGGSFDVVEGGHSS